MKFFDKLMVGKKIAVGYLVMVATILIASAITLPSLINLTDEFTYIVEHDLQVLSNAARLEKLLIDMETGERGYLITGKDEFLEPYNAGQARFNKLIEDQIELVGDNQAQVKALEEINQLKDRWLQKAAIPEIAKRSQVNKSTIDASNLQEILLKSIGKDIMDEMRMVLDKIVNKARKEQNVSVIFWAISAAKAMVDQETGQRGFLLTGNEDFLEPYKTGEELFEEAINALRMLNTGVHDIAAMKGDIKKLESLALQWKAEAAGPEIAARREMDANPVGMKDVAAMIDSGVGKSILDGLRTKFIAFTEVEVKLTAQRKEDAHNTATTTEILSIFMQLVVIILSLFMGFAATRAITGNLAMLSKAATEVAGGELDRTVEITSQDEVGILAKAFNQMTQRLREMFETSKKQRLEAEERRQEAENLREKSDKLAVEAKEQAQRLEQQKDRLAEEVVERQKSEEKFRVLLESSPDGMIIVNRAGDIILINRQTKKLFGYRSEELLGQKIELLIPEPFAARHPKQRDSYFNDPHIRATGSGKKLLGLRKGGREFPMEISLSPVETGGEVAAIASIRDITERKRVEEELEKHKEHLEELVEQRTAELSVATEKAEDASRSKSEFLANVSHELRTPMNAIIGGNYLMQETKLSNKQGEYCVEIQQASRNLQGIIDNILDFSSIETGELTVETGEFILDEVLARLTDQLAVVAKKKGLGLEVVNQAGLTTSIIGDSRRLEQVLRQLTENALKFTDTGTVTIIVESVEAGKEQLTFRFSVKDTGIGMDSEQLKQLFQTFTQGDGSSTRKVGGLGLGLSICKRLVELLSGEIKVESEVGKGTTFSFTANFGNGHEITPSAQPVVIESQVEEMGSVATVFEPPDVESLRPRLQELIELLKINDMQAQNVFAEIRERLASVAPAETKALEKRLAAFDFKAAAGLMVDICDLLNIEQEEEVADE